eukprot:979449-Ditylum_brightwellii.AAC.1
MLMPLSTNNMYLLIHIQLIKNVLDCYTQNYQQAQGRIALIRFQDKYCNYSGAAGNTTSSKNIGLDIGEYTGTMG